MATTGGDDAGNDAVEYLVGCAWTSSPPSPSPSSSSSSSCPSSPALHLLAGNSRGDGYLFRVDFDRATPLARLKGGHGGCIRDFCWIDDDDRGGGGRMRLVTGGEDARLCEWDLSSGTNGDGDGDDDDDDDVVVAGFAGGGAGGGGRARSGRGAIGDGRRGKKKFSSPY